MRPKAVIFSDADFFALDLVEALLTHNLVVYVFSENVNWWRQATMHLAHNQNLLVKSLHETLPSDVAYIFANHRKGLRQTSLEMEKNFMIASGVKACFLFSLFDQNTQSLPKGPAVIYMGEIFGPRLSNEGRINNLFSGFLPREDLDIFPLYTKDAVKEILRQIFSYGFEKSQFGLAEREKAYVFFDKIKAFKPEIKYQYVDLPEIIPLEVEILPPKEKVASALENTLDWLEKNKPQPLASVKENKKVAKKPGIKKTKTKKQVFQNFPRRLSIGLVGIFWILMLPLISVFAGGAFLKISYNSLLAGNMTAASIFLQTSKSVAGLGLGLSSFFNHVPLVGTVYASTAETLEIVDLATEVGEKTLTTASKGKELILFTFDKDKEADFEKLSEELYLELDSLYEETSFLQGEVGTLPGLIRGFASDLSGLEQNRGRIGAARALAADLPAILGSGSPTTYLVLLQNNMELRPTGGFIGSFALVTFEDGKFIDFVVYDVYSADGQLKGHIEPPPAIKNYLGEANWFLRDSNWDPDFPTSAERAEWFLDKELDRGVDGVIALDLEVFKSLLRLTGPIDVVDYETQVDANNIYEKVQYQVEADFFPGSRKKANFLTALSNSLLAELDRLQDKDYTKVARAIFDNLESRDIQVFLHQKESGRALARLGWDGGWTKPACPRENCQTLSFGVNEANLGVNKVNRFITRESSFSLREENSSLVSNLNLKIRNSAPPALGLGGRYKVYLRLLVGSGATIEDIGITGLSGRELRVPELARVQGRTEAGVLVEIPAGQEKTVNFSWREPVEATAIDFVQIHWRKQSGVGSQNARVQVDLGAPLYYNTDLSRDFMRMIPWQKQAN